MLESVKEKGAEAATDVVCGRYPAHLRPLRQAMRYNRMSIEMLRDLELDERPTSGNTNAPPTVDEARTVLACYYMSFTFVTPSFLLS
jgi:hypothetical protein